MDYITIDVNKFELKHLLHKRIRYYYTDGFSKTGEGRFVSNECYEKVFNGIDTAVKTRFIDRNIEGVSIDELWNEISDAVEFYFS